MEVGYVMRSKAGAFARILDIAPRKECDGKQLFMCGESQNGSGVSNSCTPEEPEILANAS